MHRIAVVGHGHWGKNLARVFFQMNVLVAVCDNRLEVGQVVVEQYPGVEFIVDYEALLRRADVNAVAIATPAITHYEMTKRALLAGKDVFVEKPLALIAAQGRELVELARQRERILMVGHLLRYHPAVNHLKHLIDSGALGKLYYLYSNRLNLGRFRKEENILWSFAPHDVSVMLYLLNEMPIRVAAHGGSYLHPKIADTTITTLSFPSGVQSHIFVSWLHPHKEHRLVVVGSEGMAVFADTDPDHKLRVLKHPVEWRERTPVPRLTEAQSVPFEQVEPLYIECQHFLDCLKTRRTPYTDGEEALRVLEVLEACQHSLNQNGIPRWLTHSSSSTYFAHETAVIDEPCEIGIGTRIWHFSHIMPHAKIGRNCNIGQNVFIASDVVVGNNVKIQNNVSLYTGVILEDDVFCGPSVVFTNVINPRSHVSRKSEYKSTIVKRGATLGANCTIVCGVTVGRYAFVGAGAVVTHDVPDYALVIGIPARVAGWVCQCGVRLQFEKRDGFEHAQCVQCGMRYQKEGEYVREVSV
ncbi:MAG: oxidoreductase [Fimbriimonadales bacterium]|nr:MAG: oxidoreductase [Fimbriimonadales bacterium]GIW61031.1 MAG: oxidoreductase [Patescibacteria group bacterium]